MRFRRIRWRFLLFAVMVSAVSLANSGCLAALLGTAAAGGAVGYAYYRGNVYQDYAALFGSTWGATQQALRAMQMPIVSQTVSVGSGEIESVTADGQRVMIYLQQMPAGNGPLTRVHVRVGFLGDHELSGYLHNLIAAHLQQGPPQPQPQVIQPTAATGPNHVAPRLNPVPDSKEPPLAIPKQSAPPQAGLSQPIAASGPVESVPVKNSSSKSSWQSGTSK